jgi:hypothetical protein
MDNVLKIVIQDDGQQPGEAQPAPTTQPQSQPQPPTPAAQQQPQQPQQGQEVPPRSTAQPQPQRPPQVIEYSSKAPLPPAQSSAAPSAATPIGPSAEGVSKAAGAAETVSRGGIGGGMGGKVGAGLVVANAAGQALASVFDQVAKKASAAGSVATPLAAGRNLEGVSKAAHIASNALGTIPVVGAPAARILKAFTTVTAEAINTMNAFADRGRELAAYDGRLAAATANADVRRMQGDIREAKALGEKMSQMIEKQSQVEDTIRDMLLPVKEFILDKLIDFIQFARDALVTFLELFKMLPGVNEDWADRMIEKLQKPKPVDSTVMLDKLYKDLNSLLPGPAMFDPRSAEPPGFAPILDIG